MYKITKHKYVVHPSLRCNSPKRPVVKSFENIAEINIDVINIMGASMVKLVKFNLSKEILGICSNTGSSNALVKIKSKTSLGVLNGSAAEV
jgi:hypothetical protein